MNLDSNTASVLISLITAIAGYFGGYRSGRKRFRKTDVGPKGPSAQW